MGRSRMRGDRGLRRGRWLWLLLAGLTGYLLGDWHAATVRSTDFSPSQNVALRFPEANADTVVADAAADTPTGDINAALLRNAQLALLSPTPMVPVAVPPPAAAAAPVSAESALAAPPAPRTEVKATAPSPPPPAPPRAASRQSSPGNAARHASRPGFLLNDAQIASIKERLHLTLDQERMWPGVEAALRNIAYAKTRVAQRAGAPANTEAASLDADSAEVQGLKSAAIPLLMSFNDEQKNEVRSLAHVMGLDRLASEF
jgi:hypothetical protein